MNTDQIQTANISVRDVMSDAKNNKWAIGGYNMHNVETTQALLLAAEQSKSPIFLQIGRAIIPHMGLTAAFNMVQSVVAQTKIGRAHV